MNKEWRSFLLQQGAEIKNDNVIGFGDPRPASPEDAFVCDLSARGLISISGSDAVSFMQGQFTTNIPDITPEKAQLSAWCTPKGRVLAVFTIRKHADAYFLTLPRELVARLVRRLQMYVLRSDVKVQDLSAKEWISIGCQGEKTKAMLADVLGPLPNTAYEISNPQPKVTLLCVPGLSPRYEVIGSTQTMMALWSQLSPPACARAETTWTVQAIASGVPSIQADTTEEYLPQMLNLELIGGVDFDKGCYAGQEIVARAHYLGKVKRRMYLGDVRSSIAPKRGTLLVDGHTDVTLGKIVDTAQTSEDGFLALAVVNVDSLEGGPIYLGTNAGPIVHLSRFPYMDTAGS